ncbi:type I-E CRISPR-associated protein Cse2/CasB [Actinokineospora sp. 24-640]
MPSDRATRFVDFIVGTARDTPGARADLRSGLGRPIDAATRVHCYLARFSSPSSPHATAVLYTVASLIAVNLDNAIPERSPGSLGASIGLAGHLAEKTREDSVHLLARQPAAQLCRALTRVVVPLRQSLTKNAKIDFARLIDDAISWRTGRQRIGSQWLQDYYRTCLRVNDDITDL